VAANFILIDNTFMMAAYRVVVAERKDIAIVTLVCGECKSEVSVHAETATVPVSCPSCGMDYGAAAKTALEALGTFHRMATKAETHSAGKPIFRFQIKQSE
jgi:ribosomal protein S27E